MKVVAVIAEYNPFHLGHLHHLAEIKRAYPDAIILIVMSGNYVQRGDVALTDKYSRAKMAIEGGANLVLELPFPHAIGSAKDFAFGAVSLLHKLGVVDVLSFGSECGDIENLLTLARETEDLLKENKHLEAQHTSESFARKILRLHAEMHGENPSLALPNDTLALEYIRMLNTLDSDIALHTIPRTCSHHKKEIAQMTSASAIREAIRQGGVRSAHDAMPNDAYNILSAQEEKGAIASISRLSSAILAFLRIQAFQKTCSSFDDVCGVKSRILHASRKATSYEDLQKLSATKRYSTACIRRNILQLFFGITSAELIEQPHFALVLAMDTYGRELLKEIKRKKTLPLLTKPADYTKLSSSAKEEAKCMFSADLLYALSMQNPNAYQPFEMSPHCKKG